MPRKITPQQSPFPFHIGNRTVNRELFPIRILDVWDIFCDELNYCHIHFGFKILSFVLMPNHFHLIGISEEFPMGNVMLHLQKVTALRINQQAGRINHLWGTRHWKSMLLDQNHFFNTYKYVYQNPLRARLCGYCEEWPYSTLHQKLGLSPLHIPIEQDTILFNGNFDSELKWLNTEIGKEDLSDVRKALRRNFFKYPRRRGQTNPLEVQRL